MRKLVKWFFAAPLLFVLTSGEASACFVYGYVKCDATGEGIPNAKLTVTSAAGFFATSTSDASGLWGVSDLPYGGTYTVTIDVSAIPGGGVISPGTSTDVDVPAGGNTRLDFSVTSSACPYTACWLTGGGAKFSTVTGTLLAEKGPQISFGGNVNPGCSPTAGDGGQWNHIDHGRKLHFQGLAVQVTNCGNVAEIPPGSTSPATPYNFIEFSGTGRLNPLSGFKPSTPLPDQVCFTARAEDRNEPGSSGNRDGARIDRYFLRVTDCAGTTLLFLSQGSVTGNVADDTPIAITDGNLQIHITSCSQ